MYHYTTEALKNVGKKHVENRMFPNFLPFVYLQYNL